MLDMFQKLYTIVKKLRSPDGCPWDREQSPMSIRGNLLEETLECIDAIEENNDEHIREELGDIYLLATMIGYMYEEKNSFTIAEVLADISEKLIRRHPHVFGNVSVDSSEQVLRNWEHIKQNIENADHVSLLDSIPKGLHPLERAYKLQKKAAKYGFDWYSCEGIYEKIETELAECKEASDGENKDALESELGDLLFSVINLCRFMQVDPALALHKTNKKFKKRFTFLENKMETAGKKLSKENFELMDSLWEESKKHYP